MAYLEIGSLQTYSVKSRMGAQWAVSLHDEYPYKKVHRTQGECHVQVEAEMNDTATS